MSDLLEDYPEDFTPYFLNIFMLKQLEQPLVWRIRRNEYLEPLDFSIMKQTIELDLEFSKKFVIESLSFAKKSFEFPVPIRLSPEGSEASEKDKDTNQNRIDDQESSLTFEAPIALITIPCQQSGYSVYDAEGNRLVSYNRYGSAITMSSVYRPWYALIKSVMSAGEEGNATPLQDFFEESWTAFLWCWAFTNSDITTDRYTRKVKPNTTWAKRTFTNTKHKQWLEAEIGYINMTKDRNIISDIINNQTELVMELEKRIFQLCLYVEDIDELNFYKSDDIIGIHKTSTNTNVLLNPIQLLRSYYKYYICINDIKDCSSSVIEEIFIKFIKSALKVVKIHQSLCEYIINGEEEAIKEDIKLYFNDMNNLAHGHVIIVPRQKIEIGKPFTLRIVQNTPMITYRPIELSHNIFTAIPLYVYERIKATFFIGLPHKTPNGRKFHFYSKASTMGSILVVGDAQTYHQELVSPDYEMEILPKKSFIEMPYKNYYYSIWHEMRFSRLNRFFPHLRAATDELFGRISCFMCAANACYTTKQRMENLFDTSFKRFLEPLSRNYPIMFTKYRVNRQILWSYRLLTALNIGIGGYLLWLSLYFPQLSQTSKLMVYYLPIISAVVVLTTNMRHKNQIVNQYTSFYRNILLTVLSFSGIAGLIVMSFRIESMVDSNVESMEKVNGFITHSISRILDVIITYWLYLIVPVLLVLILLACYFLLISVYGTILRILPGLTKFWKEYFPKT